MLSNTPSTSWHQWLHPAEIELRDVWDIIERTQRCVLVSHAENGERHARALRLRNHSRGRHDSLWLCVPRGGTAATDVRCKPDVCIEIDDTASARTLRLTGHASLMEQRPSPTVLHPSVAREVPVVCDDIDFVLMRVEIDEIVVEQWEKARLN